MNINNIERIEKYIKSGCNAGSRIGLELEHFVCNGSYEIIPYDVMSECLNEIKECTGGGYYSEHGEIFAITAEEYTVSIEPGCQLEISISPKENISEIVEIYGGFRKICDDIFGKRGYFLLEKGIFPTVENGEMSVDDMPLIPKERYHLMDEYFLKTGKYGRHMMRATASTQVSIDFSSEEDALKKMRVFQKLAPLLSLVAENKNGIGLRGLGFGRHEQPMHLLRNRIWNDVDKARCGYFKGSAAKDYSFKKYAEYIYTTPCILYQREGVAGAENLGEQSACDYFGEDTIDGISHLLSMFFPMVRLKKYLELRFADSMPIERAGAYAALIRTIAYNENILDEMDELFSGVSEVSGIYEAESAIMRDGYDAVVYGKDVKEWLHYIFDMIRRTKTGDADMACGLLPLPVVNYAYKKIVMENEKEHIESAVKMREYLLNSTAKYHNRAVRTLYLPKIFTETDIGIFAKLTDTLYEIFDKVIAEYISNPDYRKLFGFSRNLESLILRNRKKSYKCNVPMARIDIFYDEQTRDFKFCEFNTDGSSAMNEDREMNIALGNTKAFCEFEKEYEVSSFELFDTWADEAVSIYREWDRSGSCKMPHVVIADFMEYATINEFMIFKESFEKKGCKVTVCDIRELKWDGVNCTEPSGGIVDMIYRRAVTSDIMAYYDDVRDFITAVENDAVCLVGDFRTQIAHNKILFKILHMPETARFLTKGERLFIDAHVPFTISLEKDTEDKFPGLMTEVVENRERWIIKPEDSYGSRGVYAGVEYKDMSGWKEVIDGCRDKGYILQEFVSPYRLDNIDFLSEKNPGWTDTANLTGLFVYNGRFSGIYSRISFDMMVSTQYNEMALPTIIAKSRKGNE